MITVRDQQLLETLLQRVRLLSVEQVADAWWPDGAPPVRRLRAARRIQLLSRRGWLACYRVLARPLLALTAPVISWSPGQPEPRFAAASWKLQSRWRSSARGVNVCCALPQAARSLGGTARGAPKNLCQVTHDLHVATVYLTLRVQLAEAGLRWCGEDAVERPPAPGEACPDALLLDPSGNLTRIVEFGGCYRTPRLRKLHHFAARLGIPYDIW